ncbi:hypothetical protein [Beijerinckia sp. L45]|uniref:hypothetical protein n=1 Tax=Beijerinckia sp. L45 TaxID=1641855 RepID=UPI00131B463B|nr:hypothetical protein [Beijerinckia sp. L45]
MLHSSLETGDVAPQRPSVSTDRTIPQGTVRLLPPAAFRSRIFQAEEDAAIWTRAWVCAGFAAEIPNAGDVLPFTIGTHGIHIERLADGSLVGRFNKAQHGGCRAVPLQCQTGAKTKCSFTACGYSRDRRPIAADDVNREASLDQYLGLRPERLLTVPVKTWGPLLLVQLDPEAKTGFDWPSPEVVLKNASFAENGAMATRWLEHDANWKHLATCLADGVVETMGGSHAVREGGSVLLYPNVVILADHTVTAVVILQPTALGRTLSRIRLFAREASALCDASACEAILATIATRAAAAEARQRDAIDETAGDPMRAWFEAKVSAATDALHDEVQTATLYQTQDKGGW